MISKRYRIEDALKLLFVEASVEIDEYYQDMFRILMPLHEDESIQRSWFDQINRVMDRFVPFYSDYKLFSYIGYYYSGEQIKNSQYMYYMIPNNMFTEICEKLEAELKRIIPKTSYYLGDRETVEYYEDTAALLIYMIKARDAYPYGADFEESIEFSKQLQVTLSSLENWTNKRERLIDEPWMDYQSIEQQGYFKRILNQMINLRK